MNFFQAIFCRMAALTILCFIFSTSAFSQTSLSGMVVNAATLSGVEMASVIIKNDSKIISGTLTDLKGNFTLTGITPGTYILQVSFIGFQTSNQNVTLKQGNNILELPVKLRESAQLLNEALVSATVSEKVSDIERTRINTSGTIAASKGSLAELLRSSASVTLDNSNNISIRGNSNILILIDGIPTTVGTLEGIPASNAESIEIITNPGVKYDSEGTGGIINIVSRREKREGLSFLSTINYGFTKRVNGDITTSGNLNGWNITLNIAGKSHNEEVKSELSRKFNTSGNSAEQKIFSSQKQSSVSSALSVGKKFKSGDGLNFNFKFYNPEIANLQNISNKSISGSSYILSNRISDFKHIRNTFEATAEYKMILKKDVSDLSFRGSFSRTKGERPGKYYEDKVFVQQSEGGGYPTNYFFQADLSQKTDKKGVIELGLKYFSRGNEFRTKTYQLDISSGEWIYNTFFSSDLTHKEDIYSGYFNYSSSPKEKISYKIGLRAEYSYSEFTIIENPEEIKYDKLFLSPAFQLKNILTENSSLSFNFSRRITRPVYIQINPYVNMIDKSIFETGNKNLKPEVTNKFDLMYIYSLNGTQLQASLYLSASKDYITQISSAYSEDALMLTYVNGDKNYKGGLELNGKYKFGKRISSALNTNLFYGKTTGEVNGFDMSNKSLMFTGNMSINYNLKKWGELTAQYFYTSAQTFPQFKSSPIHFCDLGYKKGLAKEKISLTITLSDLFNTRKWNIESDNHIYSLKNLSKSQSRVLWIGLSFNFNKMQLTKPGKKEEDVETGLIRLGY
ncbi:MAG: TonB-dependent receptor [Bacteroidales bacterium]